jgi:hypothetical protein
MRLTLGMLVGLSIGALVGLAFILALFFAPYDEPLEFEGGGLQLSFLYFIAAIFIAGCGIFGGIIGLAATAAVSYQPDSPKQLGAYGRTEVARCPPGKAALPCDDFA